MAPPEDPPATWREHAEEAGRQLWALDALRAMADPDGGRMDAFADRMDALEDLDDYGAADLNSLCAALSHYAVIFARRAHGSRYLDVLAAMHEQVRTHIADYEPPAAAR